MPDAAPCLCGECGAAARPATGAEVYGPRSRFAEVALWLCPGCGAYVGAREDGSPLGTPAGATTRSARKAAHAYFDQLWRGPDATMTRSAAYRWLQREFCLSAAEAHIGRMGAGTAWAVVRRLRELGYRTGAVR